MIILIIVSITICSLVIGSAASISCVIVVRSRGYPITAVQFELCNRTVSLRARQSSALNWVLLILVSPLLATGIEYIRDVLITSEKGRCSRIVYIFEFCY